MNRIAIGVDIGTTSTKAVAFSTAGRVLANDAVEYPLLQPEPAAAEQDPEQIYRAVLSTIASCVRQCKAAPGDVLCVSFSAAMHSLILVDEHGAPLTRSITWADHRSAAWAGRIRAEWEGDAIYHRTGTPIHPMSPLAKLVWLRHERPELFAQARRFVGIKEYVFFRLFGRWLVDHSIASATGLFNIGQLDWDAGRSRSRVCAPSSSRISCPRLGTWRDWRARRRRSSGCRATRPSSSGPMTACFPTWA